MFIYKFTLFFVSSILVILLAVRYVKRYAPENLVIIPLLCISYGMYIPFAIYNAYIPIYIQILFIIFSIIIPTIAVTLQYNNIVLSRKILYYSMKWAYFSKNYEKTMEYIVKLVSLEGRNAEYLYILGQCYKEKNDFINSRDCFSLAIEFDELDYKSYYELGLIYDGINRKKNAMEMFDMAIKIKPDFYEAKEALGICLTSQGRFEDAVKVYTKALNRHPDSYVLYYNIGMIQLELKNYKESKEAFEKSAVIKPDLYTAYYNIGNIDYINGEYDLAIEAYKRVLNSNLYSPKAYYKIAICYCAKKEYEKSMSSLEYAIELDAEYLNKIKSEFVFTAMKDLIDGYMQKRKEQLEIVKENKNYMSEKFFVFNKNKKSMENLKNIQENEILEKAN